MRSKWKQRGMLTVEASMIFSLILIVLGLMLSLMLHAYRNCWYTQVGCETVLAGSSQGVLKNSSGLSASQKRLSQLKKEFYTIPDNFDAFVSQKGENLLFYCEGTTTVLGFPNINMKIQIEQRICKPVVYIRKMMKMHNVTGDAYDSGI